MLTTFEGVARWVDPTRTLAPMAEHVMSATEWAHAWRITRSEVS